MRTLQLTIVFLLLCFVAAACGDDAGPPATEPAETPTAGESGSPTATAAPTVSPTPTPLRTVTILGGGDVMLGRTIGEGIEANGPAWPFEHILDVLGDADIAFVNLESPLTARGEPLDKDFAFRGPPAGAEGLADAGIDAVTMANNHAYDYGLTGLQDTWAALAAAGVVQTGSGENEAEARSAAIVTVNGLRVALLAYVNTPVEGASGFDTEETKATARRAGVAWLTPGVIGKDVAEARKVADVVVVAMHAGLEYTEAPIALQTESAQAAIDAGASVVFGHHPHVLQGIETYNGGVIIYSLGNLVFDLDFLDYRYPGLPSTLSGMLSVEVSKSGVVACEFVPMVIAEEDGRPWAVSGVEAAPVLERMRRLSDGSCGL